jgi:hypothetical protein
MNGVAPALLSPNMAQRHCAATEKTVRLNARAAHGKPLPCRPAQARRYLGPEDASQDVLQFCAQTSAAAAAAGPAARHGVPLLPPGLLVDGLPAAVLSRCQARSCGASQKALRWTICDKPCCSGFCGAVHLFDGRRAR